MTAQLQLQAGSHSLRGDRFGGSARGQEVTATMSADPEEQEDELLALQSILGPEEFTRSGTTPAGEVRVALELPTDFTVALTEGETVRQYEISFLPPLLLSFVLPEDYPSFSPPSFTLTCSWLTHSQLSALGSQLTDLYQTTRGSVVLFSWVQFIREDALSFLDIHTQLELPSDEHSQDSQNAESETHKNHGPSKSGTTDDSAPSDSSLEVSTTSPHPSSSSGQLDKCVQGAASLPVYPKSNKQTHSGLLPTPSQNLLSQILISDAAQKQKVFDTTVFDCGVCFVGWLGSQCVQLPECGHIFCKGCLTEFCRVQITEGNVRSVTCPEANCKASPTPAQVKDLIGERLFSRYDRLLLQSTLDLMSDVFYCPRQSCGSPVIQEKSSNAALCSVCGFAFCVSCRKTYHGTERCQPKGHTIRRLQIDQQGAHIDLPQSQDGIRALWDDYYSGSKQRQRLLQSRYGCNTLNVVLPGILSEDWEAFNSKICPHCFSKIEKNGGCNVMTCFRCRQRFCWLCLTRLSGYNSGSHFQDGPCSAYT